MKVLNEYILNKQIKKKRFNTNAKIKLHLTITYLLWLFVQVHLAEVAPYTGYFY